MRYVAGTDRFRASVRIAVTLGALTGAPLCIGCSSDDDSNGDGGNLSTAGGTAGVVGAGGAAASSAGGAAGSAASAGTGGQGGSSASTGSGGSGGRSGGFGGEMCMGLPPQNTSASGGSGGSAGASTGADAGATEGGAPDSSAGGSASGGASGGGSSDGGPCVGVSAGAESIPVDMYVMMDHSVSMLEPAQEGGTLTRWDAVKSSVQQFVSAPEAAGVGVGIDFFPAGTSATSPDSIVCDPNQYAMPRVGIGLLPGVGPDILAAIDAEGPRGLTPTIPAMRGAVDYTKSWAIAHPERATVIVLVSDGLPTICPQGASALEVADVARDAFESDPPIRTFVIGLSNTAEGGSLQLNLDGIARAGGTGSAFLIQSGDVGQQFLDAILHIAKTPLSCEFQVPDPPSGVQQIDFDRVAVMYTPQGGETEEIPKLQYASECAASEHGGFYYDNPSVPTAIRVCPCNCNRFAAGQVDIQLGCEPQPGSIQ